MKLPVCRFASLAALIFVPAALFAQYSPPPEVKTLRNIEYVPGGGRSRSLDLYLPKQAGPPTPVIIWIHGGSWNEGSKEGGPGTKLPGFGFAVAKINYRLSQEAVFPAQIQDCKAAVRFLRAHASEYHLDPNHIGVWGASAGGHLAALLGTSGGVGELEGKEGNLNVSSKVQAVCDWFGPTNFTPIAGHGTAESQAAMDNPKSGIYRLLGGPVSAKQELAKLASPVTFVRGGNPPFLIMHGDHDPLIPLEQSELLYKRLQGAGVQSTLYVVQGGGHATGFDRPEIARMLVVFFTRHLHPER